MDTLLYLIWFLIIFLICATALYVLITYVLAVYEKRLEYFRHQLSLPHAEQNSKAAALHIWKGVIIEFFATLAAIVLSIFMYCPWKENLKKRTSPGKPILLIHGYLHNQSGWTWFRYKLRRAGLGPIYSLNLPFFAPIEEMAALVAEHAIQIEKETGIKELILIGHSLGGLVASYYTEALAPEGSVSHVITLGTPLSGTRVAALGHGFNAIQMIPGSPFLVQLSSRMLLNPKVHYFHLASEWDNIIIPSSSALLGNHRERQCLLKETGHISMLFSPTIVNQVVTWLK